MFFLVTTKVALQSGIENSFFPVLSVKQICWFSFISKSPLNRNSRLFLAAWLLALLYLLPDPQQLFVVVLSYAGRVDPHTDMLETPVLMEHCLDSPGIFKAAKVIVHVKIDAPDLRVAFQKCNQRHMGSTAQR